MMNEFIKKEALVKKYPKVEEWVRHKQSWEHMSMVGIFEDYWKHILEMIEEEKLKETRQKLKW